jgi:DNA-binding transcriptional MerR regulator
MTARLYHPLRVVAQRTGLSPDLLRAWERRYRVVRPRRSPGGQRLYSDEDIERLRQLHRAVLAGHAIGQVARLDRAALASLVQGAAAAGASSPARKPDETERLIEKTLGECLEAIGRLDAGVLERTLRNVALRISVPVLLDRLIAPLLWQVGERWESGSLQPVHEHLASVEVHRVLSWLVQMAPVKPDAPVLAVTTPAGQQMELGALMAAATAASEGWRIVWLGPNLPARDIVLAVETLKPGAVAISLVHQTRDPALHRELEQIARGVSGTTTLLVGGRAAAPHALLLERLGARVMPDLDALRGWLRSTAAH